MRKFDFQRGVKKSWLEIAAWFGSPVRRRQRRFAGAESLESRALLSATGTDSSTMPAHESLPPAPALIVSIGEANSNWTPAMAAIDLELAVGLDTGDHVFEPQFLSEPRFPFGMSDAAFEAIAQNSPAQQTPAVGGYEHHRSFSDLFASFMERSVEVRFAETGQVVAVGSSSAVQDSNGLTVSDDGAPTTYLHSTDADGRTYSRLVFITRTTRSAPSSELPASNDASGVVVADVESAIQSADEELAARPDLHDLETALDSANPETATSPSSQLDDSQPLLAATTRTLRTSSARAATSLERASSTASGAAASDRQFSTERASDDNRSSDDLSVAPFFDPTTRNVVLSVCVLGTLARANARRRRRQKVALAQ